MLLEAAPRGRRRTKIAGDADDAVLLAQQIRRLDSLFGEADNSARREPSPTPSARRQRYQLLRVRHAATSDFVMELRGKAVTPHVAQNLQRLVNNGGALLDDALPDEPGRPRCPLPQWRVVRPSILCGRSVVNNSGA